MPCARACRRWLASLKHATIQSTNQTRRSVASHHSFIHSHVNSGAGKETIIRSLEIAQTKRTVRYVHVGPSKLLFVGVNPHRKLCEAPVSRFFSTSNATQRTARTQYVFTFSHAPTTNVTYIQYIDSQQLQPTTPTAPSLPSSQSSKWS